MRWVRSWPRFRDGGCQVWTRANVTDPLSDVLTMDRDYREVLAQLDGAAVIVEWDLAVSCEDRARFDLLCEAQPDAVHVAPYLLYPTSTGWPRPVWAHRRVEGPRSYRWIVTAEAECDLFGLGLAYIPAEVRTRALAEIDGAIADDSLSLWHYAAGLGPVSVAWDVRPIHLHYSAADVAAHYAALAGINSRG